MHDSCRVRCIERGGNLCGDVERFGNLQSRRLQFQAQCLAFDKLDGDKVCVAFHSDFVNSDDVRMIESRCCSRLLLEAMQAFTVID